MFEAIVILLLMLTMIALFGLSAHRYAQANKLHSETLRFLASHGVVLSDLSEQVGTLVNRAKTTLTSGEAAIAKSEVETVKAEIVALIQKAESLLGIKTSSPPTTTSST